MEKKFQQKFLKIMKNLYQKSQDALIFKLDRPAILLKDYETKKAIFHNNFDYH